MSSRDTSQRSSSAVPEDHKLSQGWLVQGKVRCLLKLSLEFYPHASSGLVASSRAPSCIGMEHGKP